MRLLSGVHSSGERESGVGGGNMRGGGDLADFLQRSPQRHNNSDGSDMNSRDHKNRRPKPGAASLQRYVNSEQRMSP